MPIGAVGGRQERIRRRHRVHRGTGERGVDRPHPRHDRIDVTRLVERARDGVVAGVGQLDRGTRQERLAGSSKGVQVDGRVAIWSVRPRRIRGLGRDRPQVVGRVRRRDALHARQERRIRRVEGRPGLDADPERCRPERGQRLTQRERHRVVIHPVHRLKDGREAAVRSERAARAAGEFVGQDDVVHRQRRPIVERRVVANGDGPRPAVGGHDGRSCRKHRDGPQSLVRLEQPVVDEPRDPDRVRSDRPRWRSPPRRSPSMASRSVGTGIGVGDTASVGAGVGSPGGALDGLGVGSPQATATSRTAAARVETPVRCMDPRVGSRGRPRDASAARSTPVAGTSPAGCPT